jgi:tetratricopeptide (TPR) repeat protein
MRRSRPAAPESAPGRCLAAFLFATLLLLARCSPSVTDEPRIEERHTYAAELARVEARIAALTARAGVRAISPFAYEQAAAAHLARARLTADYADYAHAESLLARAFAVSPAGAGPFLARAALHLTLHRLDHVEPDLAATERATVIDDPTRAAIAGLRADLAFHSGRYAEARAGYEAALGWERSAGALFRLAHYAWATGDFSAAERRFAEALPMLHPPPAEPLAWLHLQRGLMALDRGRWEEALAHYRRADSTLQGWWLVEEHAAEVLALQGRTGEALAMYESIVDRTGNPEFMTAIAAILVARGDTAAAGPWIRRANRAYAELLERFPEAAAGHALDHALELGADTDWAIELAERNYRLRPGGEAGLKLAQSYLKAGRLTAARAAIERVLATPWTSAELHATTARIETALGRPEAAAAARRRALAINPRIDLDAEPFAGSTLTRDSAWVVRWPGHPGGQRL